MQNYLSIFDRQNFRKLQTSKKEGGNNGCVRRFLVNLFYESLNNLSKPKKVCLVLDNAENMEEIADYLPAQTSKLTAKFDIIITSRYQKWKSPIKTIDLRSFSNEEVKRYISAKLKIEVSEEDVAQLNKLLGGLPLAISVAIDSIKANKNNIKRSDYCNEISNFKLPKKFENEIFTRQVFALIKLIEKDNLTKMILDVIPYLAPDHITLSMLKECWSRYCKDETKTEEEFIKSIELLESYSIITITDSPNHEKKDISTIMTNKRNRELEIGIHRLTQKTLRSIHKHNSTAFKYTDELIIWIMSQIKYEEDDVSEIERVKTSYLIPHAIYLSELPEFKDFESLIASSSPKYREGFASLRERIDNFGTFLRRIGDLQQYIIGDYYQAKRYYLTSLEIREKCIGDTHIELCETVLCLINICECLGDKEEQRKYTARLKTICHTGLTVFWLASMFKPQETKEKAKMLLEKGNDLSTRIGRLSAIFLKVWRESSVNSIPKALVIYFIEYIEKFYGNNAGINFRILALSGLIWGCIGELQIQEECWNVAIEVSRKTHGTDHIFRGQCLVSISNLYRTSNRYGEQKKAFEEALEIFKRSWGDEHLYVGVVTVESADACGLLGDYHQKKKYLLTAEGIFKKAYKDGQANLSNLKSSEESLLISIKFSMKIMVKELTLKISEIQKRKVFSEIILLFNNR